MQAAQHAAVLFFSNCQELFKTLGPKFCGRLMGDLKEDTRASHDVWCVGGL